MRFEGATTINAPAEKVFEYVSNFSRHPEWAGFPLEMNAPSGPLQVGTKFSSVGRQFGKNADEITITELAPGKRLVFECTGKAGLTRHTFDLAETGGQTRLTKVFEIVKPSLQVKLSSPIVKRVAPKGLAQDVERIKTKVEGGA